MKMRTNTKEVMAEEEERGEERRSDHCSSSLLPSLSSSTLFVFLSYLNINLPKLYSTMSLFPSFLSFFHLFLF